MPPRFAYWTIIVEGKPTAFRAQLREELEPTFTQLHNKHPDAVMMWFARGRLWASPEEAQAAEGRGGAERRKPDWRPGGEHRDPRARFDIPRDEKRRRFAAKLRRGPRDTEGPPPRDESGGEAPPRDRPPRDQFRPREDRPPGRPEGQRDRERPPGRPEWKPAGDRPQQRKPWTPRPDQDRGPRPPRQEGDRRPPRPEGDRRPPRPERRPPATAPGRRPPAAACGLEARRPNPGTGPASRSRSRPARQGWRTWRAPMASGKTGMETEAARTPGREGR